MTRGQNPRIWIAGAALLALLVAALGYLVLIGPQRDETDTVRSNVAAAQAQGDVLQQRLMFLAKQNKDLPKYQAALAKARLALPASSAMPEFLHTLQTISNTTGTTLTGLTVGAPAAMTQSAAPAAPAASTSSSAAANATAPGAASTGVFTVAISAQLTGPRPNLAEFLRQLQAVQPRAVLVTQLTEGAATVNAVTPGKAANSSSTSLSLSMQAFISPASAPVSAQPSATPSSGG